MTTAATATAALCLTGATVAQSARRAGARREVRLAGRRITVVDGHGHCLIPEVLEVIRDAALADVVTAEIKRARLVLGPERLELMDQEGLDIQVLSVNAFWYSASRDEARAIVELQNERLARWCRAHPERFVGLASVALQHPELAAEQLEHAITALGLKGVSIGGSVPGEELSSRRFDPFWAKAEALGAMIFMHPQPAPGTTVSPRLDGKGNLGNTIGNPLETTVFLSHLIFEGTLDRFPKLRICAAHAGGYLPSYLGRSQAACTRQPDACSDMNRPIDEYFKGQILIDSMVFRLEGLRHLVAEVGAGQIVYGTDLPFPWPVNVDFILDAPFLDNTQKEAILGGNLIKLLRLHA